MPERYAQQALGPSPLVDSCPAAGEIQVTYTRPVTLWVAGRLSETHHDCRRKIISLFAHAAGPPHAGTDRVYLGCNTDSVTVLISAGLLKPLGRPKPNASKFFALAELEVLRADTKGLARATEAIQNWHRNKNDRHCGMRPASSSTGCPGRKVSGTIRSAERFAAPADQTEPANGTHEE